MGLADLHIHTIHSHDGTCTVSGILQYASTIADLDVIAITDHDEIDGALEAVELAPEFGIEVIPGSEITTAEGHLLALFIEKRIPKDLSLLDTLSLIHQQGGIAIAAHPAARWVPSLSEAAIQHALLHQEAREVLVGIESCNAGLIHRPSNSNAARIAEEVNLASCGSSDSHVFWTVGTAVTSFPGIRAKELRNALVNRTTRAIPRNQPGPIMNVLSWLYHAALRRRGWVNSFTGFQQPIGLVRIPESVNNQ